MVEPTDAWTRSYEPSSSATFSSFDTSVKITEEIPVLITFTEKSNPKIKMTSMLIIGGPVDIKVGEKYAKVDKVDQTYVTTMNRSMKEVNEMFDPKNSKNTKTHVLYFVCRFLFSLSLRAS